VPDQVIPDKKRQIAKGITLKIQQMALAPKVVINSNSVPFPLL